MSSRKIRGRAAAVVVVLLAAALAAPAVFAQLGARVHTFTAGETVQATKMNENFTAVLREVDALKARLDQIADGSISAADLEPCRDGEVLKVAGGVWTCAADNDTRNFAASNQACTSGQFMTGINSSGIITCATPPPPSLSCTVRGGNPSVSCQSGEVLTGSGWRFGDGNNNGLNWNDASVVPSGNTVTCSMSAHSVYNCYAICCRH